MTPLRFTKMAGAGNDFVLVEAERLRPGENLPRLARRLCDRKRGIGADGLLLVGSSRNGSARMRIFNPDGSEPDMCGNGARCAAWYLHPRGKKTLSLATGAGPLTAHVTGGGVRLFLSRPRSLNLNLSLAVGGRRWIFHSVNTGVPHAVSVVKRIQDIDVERVGRSVRFHSHFKPRGTNVDFIQIVSPRRLIIRTYERGVEGETLACGTGAAASVVIGERLGLLKPPVSLTTASGELLRVGYVESGTSGKQWYLEGTAQKIFEGEINR
ncbi:MAG: diaminopimelate epimerase [Candidatus Omnitrophica bacterium]|nr:diaminopimelate epimerase [Candidatus Omnitrophota bacterium]